MTSQAEAQADGMLRRTCMQASPEVRATLGVLFRNSQLAERASDRHSESTTCYKPEPPLDIRKVRIDPSLFGPRKLFDKQSVLQQLKKQNDRHFDISISLENTEYEDTIYAGCTVDSVLWAVAIRLYEIAGSLFVETDVAAREGVAWVPLQIYDNGHKIGFPGTKVEDLRQVATNFVGETCVFPVATYAIESICNAYREKVLKDSSGNRLQWTNSVTMAGHSLGGAAVQYIASYVSTDCPKVVAYAFGSTGMKNAQLPMKHVELETYVSQRDWLGQSGPFRKRTQTGRITSISPVDSHSIDAIQNDICRCIKGDKGLSVLQWNENTDFRQNQEICGQDCRW